MKVELDDRIMFCGGWGSLKGGEINLILDLTSCMRWFFESGDGMIKYLVSHRAKFNQRQKKNCANNTK